MDGRYLVVFRVPQRGETFWREGMLCGVSPTDPEALDEQPVIITDANEGKLLTLAIEMRDLLDSIAHSNDIGASDVQPPGDADAARALVRRFDQWEPK